jgi:hypothetical protein
MQTGIEWSGTAGKWLVYIESVVEARSTTPTGAHELLDALLELRELEALENAWRAHLYAKRMRDMRICIEIDPFLQIGDVVPRLLPRFKGREAQHLSGKECDVLSIVEREITLTWSD